MKILSIDTASNICGVSLLDKTQLISQWDKNTGRTHSENLMPMICHALSQANLTLNDIDLFVCDKGPGSFTGIRIGVATMKAFHDSLGIPCVGVTSLEALAYSVKQDGFIACLLDSKNDNCYFALYQLKDNEYTEVIAPTADTLINALKKCQEFYTPSIPITFIGDCVELHKDLIEEKWKHFPILYAQNHHLNSYYVGLAGLEKWKKNQIEDVLPLYLKKPQAQRQWEEKTKEITITSMTLTDLDEISPILTSDFDSFWHKDILKTELTSANSQYLIAKQDHKILGFAGIKILVDEADIMNIVVRKDKRNQGIGTLLVKNLIQLCQNLNLTCMTLEVKEENYPAIHLYKNLGFEQIGVRKNYYQNQNGLIMAKKLT